jgi:hypothetical protein
LDRENTRLELQNTKIVAGEAGQIDAVMNFPRERLKETIYFLSFVRRDQERIITHYKNTSGYTPILTSSSCSFNSMGELIMASAPIFNDSISFSLLRSCAFTSGKSTSQPIHQLPFF